MSDSPQNLVKIRRSSGRKEWVTAEKLESLNKQRALKREKSKRRIKQPMSKKKWTAISVSLNVLLLIALPLVNYLSPIGLTFSATQTSCLAKPSPGKPGKDIASLEALLTQPIADKDPYQ